MLASLCMAASIQAQERTDTVGVLDAYAQNAMLLEQLKHTDWGRVMTSSALKITLMVGTVDVLKRNVHEWRPDGSADNSFPSRHAVWAYCLGGSFAYATGWKTPWVTLVMHTGANAVGQQRVMARRHWPGDVLAGAGIGLGLDILTRGVTNALYGNGNLYKGWRRCSNTLGSGMASYTGAWMPIDGNTGEYRVGTALTSGLRLTMGANDTFGGMAQVNVMTAPVKKQDALLGMLNMIEVCAGPCANVCFSHGPVALTAAATAGYRHYLPPKGLKMSRGTITAGVAAELTVTLTPRLAAGAQAGWNTGRIEIEGEGRWIGALTAGIITRACF